MDIGNLLNVYPSGHVSGRPSESAIQAAQRPPVQQTFPPPEGHSSDSLLCDLCRNFLELGAGDYERIWQFVSKNPAIVSQAKISNLMDQALKDHRAGNFTRAQICIHHAILLKKSNELGIVQSELFFKRMSDTKSDTFLEVSLDIQRAYFGISQRALPAQSPQLSPLALSLISLGPYKYEESWHFISGNPSIVVKSEIDALMAEASAADQAGRSIRALTCIHQALLLNECEEVGPSNVCAFFGKLVQGMAVGDGRVMEFIGNVCKVYPSIREQSTGVTKHKGDDAKLIPQGQNLRQDVDSVIDRIGLLEDDPFAETPARDRLRKELPLITKDTTPVKASEQEFESNATLGSSERLEETGEADSDLLFLRNHSERSHKDGNANEKNAERMKPSLDKIEETFPGNQYPEHQLQDRSRSLERTTSGLSRRRADHCSTRDTAPSLMEVDREGTDCPASADNSPPVSEGEISFIASAGSEDDLGTGDDDLSQHLQDLQSTLVRRFVREYTLERGTSMCSPGCGSTTPTGSRATSQAHGVSSRVETRGSEYGSKRTRSKRDDGKGDDEDEDNDRKRKVHQRPPLPDSDDISHELFACPYSKYDPVRYSGRNLAEKSYRGCASSFLRDISRVKQHLYRVHKRPNHYCGSCFQVFATQDALDAHTRQRPACENSDTRFSEKMTLDQLNSIKRRTKGNDATETWFNIYRTLFPNSTLPASPFCEAASSTAVLSFSERFRCQGPPMLSTLVRTRIQDSIPLGQDEQQLLDNALEEALTEIILHFGIDFEAAELAMTAVSSNLQEPDAASSAAPKNSQGVAGSLSSIQFADTDNTLTTAMCSNERSIECFRTRRQLFASYGRSEQTDTHEVPETIAQNPHDANADSGSWLETMMSKRHGPDITGRASVGAMPKNPMLKTMAHNAYAANANSWLWSGTMPAPEPDRSYNTNLYTAPQPDYSGIADQPWNFDFSAENPELDLLETFNNSGALVERPF
jgi:hypothetical protein